MDPPPVLGLAADVVQFSDFAARKCRSVQSLYETADGSLVGEIAFDRTAADFLQFSTLLKQRRKFYSRLSQSIEANERGIGKLADECSGVAKETAAIFRKLNDIHKKNNHVQSTALASMRAAWKPEDIAHMVDLVQVYQNQLALRLVQYLNATVGTANGSKRARFEIDQGPSKIVEVLIVAENKLEVISRPASSHGRKIDEAWVKAIAHHDKTLAAVLTLQNGDTKVITSKDTPRAASENGTQILMTFRIDPTTNEGSARIGDFKSVQDIVLRCLYFRSYSERVEAIKPRHKSSCEWVFQPPKTSKPPPVPLLEWLEQGSGCYWINGKAGSGKSTLMKYILNDSRTKQALSKWAAKEDLELATADFFFCSLGSRLQKSQHGLMRALLYSVLLQHPHLISVVMPELWSARASQRQDGTIAAPSFSELLQWFRRLLDIATPQYRICFFIDGLDEYEGDYFNLAEIIKSASANTNVKFLVSSRPITAFLDAFASSPGFRIQNYTQDDIRTYALDHLKDHLKSRNEEGWEVIIHQIVKKSRGVFLWAVLIVRTINARLLDFNSLGKLSRRINELPANVKDFYGAMLRLMPHSTRLQAAEFLQIALIALDMQRDNGPLTPLQMYFATLNDSAVVQAKLQPMTIQEEKIRCEAIQARLRSECAGLLEVQSINYRMEGLLTPSVFKYQVVGFIHRTVVEFLGLRGIWDDLLRMTGNTTFHPASSLCRSSILLCKAGPTERVMKIEECGSWYFMDRAMRYASMAEHHKHSVPAESLQELDKALTHKWEKAAYVSYGSQYRSTKGSHWTSAYKIGCVDVEYNKDHLAALLAPAATPLCFHSLAVFHCLADFLVNIPLEKDGGPTAGQLAGLLHDSTRNLLFDRPWSDRKGMVVRCTTICHLLLSQKADPNAKFGALQESAWDLMLKFGIRQLASKDEFRRQFRREGIAYHFAKLLVSFVTHSANVNNAVLQHPGSEHGKEAGKKGNAFYSAFKVVDLLFSDEEPAADGAPDPSKPRQQHPGAEPRSPEMVMIYDELKKLMSQKGAVAEAYNESQAMQWDEAPGKETGKFWGMVKKAKRRSMKVFLKKKV